MNKKAIALTCFCFLCGIKLSAQYISAAPAQEPDLKICTSCDTILLEEKKPQILFYNIYPTWDYSYNQSIKRYNNPIQEGSIMDREQKELQVNFPDIPIRLVNKNCRIEIPNTRWETFDLLSRIRSYSGFIYWSGNFEEPCVQSTVFSGLTELVAKARNEHKTSSYIQDFPADSLEYAAIQNCFEPSEAVRKNLRYLPLPSSNLLEYFPYQFLNLSNVKKISLSPDSTFTKTRVDISFNEDQTILKADLYENNVFNKGESLTFTYKDGLPKTIKDGDTEEFFYKQDTVFRIGRYKNGTSVRKFILKENTFLLNTSYFLTDQAIKTKDLQKDWSTVTTLNGISCVRFSRDMTCYSNLKQALPLKITESQSRRGQYNSRIELEFISTYEWKNGNLYISNVRHAEDEASGESNGQTDMIYYITNDKIQSATLQKNGREVPIYFKYEYFPAKIKK